MKAASPPAHQLPLRFAAPAYANSEPLVAFIPDVEPGAEVVRDHPANLMRLVREHSIDAALMPVAELFIHPELVVIPGTGICADGRVDSVLLKCRRPIDEVSSVRFDDASKTSNALACILLRRHWGRTVRPVAGPEDADAEVVIGDRALCLPVAPHGDHDLAAAWKQLTGLPFVFAVWVHHRDHPQPERLARAITAAKRTGLAAIDTISLRLAAMLQLRPSRMLDYFTHCIRYDLGPDELRAIERFRDLGQSENLFQS